jgi:hypothetical protein
MVLADDCNRAFKIYFLDHCCGFLSILEKEGSYENKSSLYISCVVQDKNSISEFLPVFINTIENHVLNECREVNNRVSARSSAGIVEGVVGKKKRKSEGGSAVKEIMEEAIMIKEEEIIKEIGEIKEEAETKSPKKHKKDKKEKKERRESRGEGHDKKEKKHKKDKQ